MALVKINVARRVSDLSRSAKYRDLVNLVSDHYGSLEVAVLCGVRLARGSNNQWFPDRPIVTGVTFILDPRIDRRSTVVISDINRFRSLSGILSRVVVYAHYKG